MLTYHMGVESSEYYCITLPAKYVPTLDLTEIMRSAQNRGIPLELTHAERKLFELGYTLGCQIPPDDIRKIVQKVINSFPKILGDEYLQVSLTVDYLEPDPLRVNVGVLINDAPRFLESLTTYLDEHPDIDY